MLTAAITAATGWILSQFGIAPGPYLFAVAAVVKILLVLGGVLLGAKVVRKARKQQDDPGAPGNTDRPSAPPDAK